MQRTTFIHDAAFVGLFVACAGGVTAQTPAAPATDWAKSVKITAVPIQMDEIGVELLGPDLWRFSIVGPKPLHPVDLIVEFQEKGKPALLLVSATVKPQPGWPASRRLQILVGQSSSDDGLKASARARYMVQVNGYAFASSTDKVKVSGFVGQVSAMSSTDNPFKGIMQTDTVLEPHQRSDGSFVLLTGGKSTNETKQDVPEMALVFRVQEEANPTKQAKN